MNITFQRLIRPLFFSCFCASENRMLKIENRAYFQVTPKVIGYVLSQLSYLNVNYQDSLDRNIYSYIRSAETLHYLLTQFPRLTNKQDCHGRTPLRLYATLQEQPPLPPDVVSNETKLSLQERGKIIAYLISIPTVDILTQDSLGNSILHCCFYKFIARLLLEKEPSLIFVPNNNDQMPEETNIGLKDFFAEFARDHQHLNPKDLNPLKLAVGEAIYLHAIAKDYSKELTQAKELIEKGANLSTPLSAFGDQAKSIFHHIIDLSLHKPWRELLEVALQKATQEQILEAVDYTIISILDGRTKQHWFDAARQLIQKCENPGALIIQEKTLETWDREKGWKLFSG